MTRRWTALPVQATTQNATCGTPPPAKRRAGLRQQGRASGRRLAQAVLQALVAVGAAAAGNAHAQAAAFPTRMVTLVAPVPVGGPIDQVSRLLADKLAAALGQRVVMVENRSGANGGLAAQTVAMSPPDGHTILFASSGTMITNVLLNTKLPYRVDDFAPLTQVLTNPIVLLADGKAPYANVNEFVAWAKRLGRPVTYGSWGIGSSAHLLGEKLARDAGITVTHVPYKGSDPALLDLRAGLIDVVFSFPASGQAFVRAGHLRAIAVASPERSPLFSSVPTFGEQGYSGFDSPGFAALYVPAATPPAVIDRLSKAFIDIIKMPDVRAKIVELGSVPVGNAPAAFAASYQREYQRYTELVKAAGVKPE